MTHEERVRHHLYKDIKAPLDNAERIADLEELLLDLWNLTTYWRAFMCDDCNHMNEWCSVNGGCWYSDRMSELGVKED